MTLTVTPARPNFVAEVSGVDMREPPSRTLIFRDQLITDEQRVAFTRPFGRPETAVKAYRPGFKARLALEAADVNALFVSLQAAGARI